MPLLILLFLILGIYAEFYVIIEVGSTIGAAATLLAMVGTAVIGLWLIRIQGLDVYSKMMTNIVDNKPPVKEMMHGLLLLLSGVLLIFPGFITDALGALLLLPPIRAILIFLGVNRKVYTFFSWNYRRTNENVIIEGEYTSKNNHENESVQIKQNKD